MSKGRATATFVLEHDVTDGELVITVTVPATTDDTYGVVTVNGSVALGKAVAALAVLNASVPTKAQAEWDSKRAQLIELGKTEDEADSLMAIFG